MIKKFKIIIFVCLLSIICNIVVKNYLIDGQKHSISSLLEKISSARNSSAFVPDKHLKKIFSERNDIKAIIHKIPKESLFTEYAADIWSLIDKNHLSVENSLIFKPEKTLRPYLLKYKTNIIVIGTYAEIKKLLSDIQNLPGLSFLNSVNMSREKEDQNKIKLNLEMSVFLKRGTA